MSNEPNDARSPCDLLPCPYCGRAARYVAEDYVDNSGEPWPFAECDACNTGAPVEFWNKRAQPADQHAPFPGYPPVPDDRKLPADQQGEPVAWVECSPAWLKSGGDCATASRMCVGRHGISHLHPAHAQPATAKADDQEEFEAWFLANVESDEGLTLERSAARPDQYELDETAQIYRGWLARAKLNTPL
ncbi:hypothetical protein RYA60_18600 [Pseudomonas syringae]|nr:hypothetical protein [Pseudomonas syringae]